MYHTECRVLIYSIGIWPDLYIPWNITARKEILLHKLDSMHFTYNTHWQVFPCIIARQHSEHKSPLWNICWKYTRIEKEGRKGSKKASKQGWKEGWKIDWMLERKSKKKGRKERKEKEEKVGKWKEGIRKERKKKRKGMNERKNERTNERRDERTNEERLCKNENLRHTPLSPPDTSIRCISHRIPTHVSFTIDDWGRNIVHQNYRLRPKPIANVQPCPSVSPMVCLTPISRPNTTDPTTSGLPLLNTSHYIMCHRNYSYNPLIELGQ